MEIMKRKNGTVYVTCWDNRKTGCFIKFCYSRFGCSHCGIEKFNNSMSGTKDVSFAGMKLTSGIILLFRDETYDY